MSELELSSPSILLLGDSGTGKSHSILTLLENNIETFYCALEPNALDTPLLRITEQKLPIENFHWIKAPPRVSSMQNMSKMLDAVNRAADMSSLTQSKGYDQKRKCESFAKLVRNMVDFEDERTGQKFQDVESWGPNRAIIFDSNSGLCDIARQHVAGLKPQLTQPEYGVTQEIVYQLISALCSYDCIFVLTAHLERTQNEVSGDIETSLNAIGKKLTPRLPRLFSDIVLCQRDENRYTWTTVRNKYTVKHRFLPLGENLEPSFKPIVDKMAEVKTHFAQNSANEGA